MDKPSPETTAKTTYKAQQTNLNSGSSPSLRALTFDHKRRSSKLSTQHGNKSTSHHNQKQQTPNIVIVESKSCDESSDRTNNHETDDDDTISTSTISIDPAMIANIGMFIDSLHGAAPTRKNIAIPTVPIHSQKPTINKSTTQKKDVASKPSPSYSNIIPLESNDQIASRAVDVSERKDNALPQSQNSSDLLMEHREEIDDDDDEEEDLMKAELSKQTMAGISAFIDSLQRGQNTNTDDSDEIDEDFMYLSSESESDEEGDDYVVPETEDELSAFIYSIGNSDENYGLQKSKEKVVQEPKVSSPENQQQTRIKFNTNTSTRFFQQDKSVLLEKTSTNDKAMDRAFGENYLIDTVNSLGLSHSLSEGQSFSFDESLQQSFSEDSSSKAKHKSISSIISDKKITKIALGDGNQRSIASTVSVEETRSTQIVDELTSFYDDSEEDDEDEIELSQEKIENANDAQIVNICLRIASDLSMKEDIKTTNVEEMILIRLDEYQNRRISMADLVKSARKLLKSLSFERNKDTKIKKRSNPYNKHQSPLLISEPPSHISSPDSDNDIDPQIALSIKQLRSMQSRSTHDDLSIEKPTSRFETEFTDNPSANMPSNRKDHNETNNSISTKDSNDINELRDVSSCDEEIADKKNEKQDDKLLETVQSKEKKHKKNLNLFLRMGAGIEALNDDERTDVEQTFYLLYKGHQNSSIDESDLLDGLPDLFEALSNEELTDNVTDFCEQCDYKPDAEENEVMIQKSNSLLEQEEDTNHDLDQDQDQDQNDEFNTDHYRTVDTSTQLLDRADDIENGENYQENHSTEGSIDSLLNQNNENELNEKHYEADILCEKYERQETKEVDTCDDSYKIGDSNDMSFQPNDKNGIYEDRQINNTKMKPQNEFDASKTDKSHDYFNNEFCENINVERNENSFENDVENIVKSEESPDKKILLSEGSEISRNSTDNFDTAKNLNDAELSVVHDNSKTRKKNLTLFLRMGAGISFMDVDERSPMENIFLEQYNDYQSGLIDNAQIHMLLPFLFSALRDEGDEEKDDLDESKHQLDPVVADALAKISATDTTCDPDDGFMMAFEGCMEENQEDLKKQEEISEKHANDEESNSLQDLLINARSLDRPRNVQVENNKHISDIVDAPVPNDRVLANDMEVKDKLLETNNKNEDEESTQSICSTESHSLQNLLLSDRFLEKAVDCEEKKPLQICTSTDTSESKVSFHSKDDFRATSKLLGSNKTNAIDDSIPNLSLHKEPLGITNGTSCDDEGKNSTLPQTATESMDESDDVPKDEFTRTNWESKNSKPSPHEEMELSTVDNGIKTEKSGLCPDVKTDNNLEDEEAVLDERLHDEVNRSATETMKIIESVSFRNVIDSDTDEMPLDEELDDESKRTDKNVTLTALVHIKSIETGSIKEKDNDESDRELPDKKLSDDNKDIDDTVSVLHNKTEKSEGLLSQSQEQSSGDMISKFISNEDPNIDSNLLLFCETSAIMLAHQGDYCLQQLKELLKGCEKLGLHVDLIIETFKYSIESLSATKSANKNIDEFVITDLENITGIHTKSTTQSKEPLDVAIKESILNDHPDSLKPNEEKKEDMVSRVIDESDTSSKAKGQSIDILSSTLSDDLERDDNVQGRNVSDDDNVHSPMKSNLGNDMNAIPFLPVASERTDLSDASSHSSPNFFQDKFSSMEELHSPNIDHVSESSSIISRDPFEGISHDKFGSIEEVDDSEAIDAMLTRLSVLKAGGHFSDVQIDYEVDPSKLEVKDEVEVDLVLGFVKKELHIIPTELDETEKLWSDKKEDLNKKHIDIVKAQFSEDDSEGQTKLDRKQQIAECRNIDNGDSEVYLIEETNVEVAFVDEGIRSKEDEVAEASADSKPTSVHKEMETEKEGEPSNEKKITENAERSETTEKDTSFFRSTKNPQIEALDKLLDERDSREGRNYRKIGIINSWGSPWDDINIDSPRTMMNSGNNFRVGYTAAKLLQYGEMKALTYAKPINSVAAAKEIYKYRVRRHKKLKQRWEMTFEERTKDHDGYYFIDVNSLYESSVVIAKPHHLDHIPWEYRDVRQRFLHEKSLIFVRNWFGKLITTRGNDKIRHPVCHPKSMQMPIESIPEPGEWTEDWFTTWQSRKQNPNTLKHHAIVDDESWFDSTIHSHKEGVTINTTPTNLEDDISEKSEGEKSGWEEAPEVGTLCTVRLKIGEKVSRVTWDCTSHLRRSRWRRKYFPKGGILFDDIIAPD